LTLTNLLLVLLGALVFGIYKSIENSIGNLPNRIHDKNMQKMKTQDERDLQVESYYRQISGEEIAKTFYEWTNLLTNMKDSLKELESPDGMKKLRDMQTRILMYGSSRTVKIYTLMMQHNYQLNENKNLSPEEQSYISKKTLVYFSAVIASLKEDFTGYKIDNDDILKTTITDYNTPENKSVFERASREIMQEIKKLEY